jgi:hypothetical protein
MTARNWKFSQIMSLAFVGAILGFVLIGAVAGGEGALMSDAIILQNLS